MKLVPDLVALAPADNMPPCHHLAIFPQCCESMSCSDNFSHILEMILDLGKGMTVLKWSLQDP